MQCRINPFASFACQTADNCDESYYNKVTSGLATIQRPGHAAENCKMVQWRTLIDKLKVQEQQTPAHKGPHRHTLHGPVLRTGH